MSYMLKHRITPDYMQVGGLGRFLPRAAAVRVAAVRGFASRPPMPAPAQRARVRRVVRGGRSFSLGELVPPAQSGGGATWIDFGRDLLATAGSVYFSKNQIDPTKYAPTVRVQVDPGAQAQAAIATTRNLLIGASVIGVGLVGYTILRKKR